MPAITTKGAFMPAVAGFPKLTSSRHEVDPAHLDWLEDSTDLLGDVAALHERVQRTGYLYLPGLLDRQWVIDARMSVAERLHRDGYLDPTRPLIDLAWNQQRIVKFKPDYATGNPVVEKLLYSGRMMDFFAQFFGKPAQHYDYTWLRAVCPGPGTAAHSDVVYMGRAERQQLFTVWTPLGDIDFQQGGLIVLEGSNHYNPLKDSYWEHDVDIQCTNKPGTNGWTLERKWLPEIKESGHGGALGEELDAIRNQMGGTWRTGEFQMGDILLFTCYTVHASIDNTSDVIRLSVDSRYQPEGTVRDDRWIGREPIAHGPAGQLDKIC
jgi:hypothetical protein